MFTAKIIETKVLDGDTVRCHLDLGFRIYHQIDCRLSGINAPEIRGDERDAGVAVAQFVARWLSYAETLELQSIKLDKFAGRCIGDIIRDGTKSLADALETGGMSLPWNGKGSRPKFTIEERLAIVQQVEEAMNGAL